MPRSNKKKKTTHLPSSAQPFLEPPPQSLSTHPRHNSIPDQDISYLLTKEKTLMIGRCIQSAKKHGINSKFVRVCTICTSTLLKTNLCTVKSF